LLLNLSHVVSKTVFRVFRRIQRDPVILLGLMLDWYFLQTLVYFGLKESGGLWWYKRRKRTGTKHTTKNGYPLLRCRHFKRPITRNCARTACSFSLVLI